MKVLTRFINTIDSINGWTGRWVGFLMLALMLIIVYDVVTRYVVGVAILWGLETDGFLMLAIICLGGGYALLIDSHVNVSIFYDRFPPRFRAGLNLFTYLIFFLLCAVLIWRGGEVAWSSVVKGTHTSSQWGPIIWPAQMLIPIGGVLLGLQGLAKWLRCWLIVLGLATESKPYVGGVE